jgi:hypothetical protein
MKHFVFCLAAMGASILWLLAANFTIVALVHVLSVIEKVSRGLHLGAASVTAPRLLPTAGK